MDDSSDDDPPDTPITQYVWRSAPPDGGWGWVIVLGAFVINVITDGCSYSFGVLFSYLLDYFQKSRSTTAWIGSVFCAVPLLCGPLASLITKRLGFRKATMLGGFITAIGFISSAFVNSVDTMALTYGFIAGLGISLPYLNSSVVVALYFEKKRTLVTGIAECGAGIGTLIFAPLYEYLIEAYGWRGAVLITGAISFNIVACGAVFRPVQNKYVRDKVSTNVIDEDKSDGGRYAATLLVTPEPCDSVPNLMLESRSVLGESVANAPPVIKAAVSYRELCEIEHNTKCQNCIEKNKSFVDISVLSNTGFLVFLLSNIILFFWYDVPYVFTVDRAKLFGISEKMAAIIVAVIGISHTVGNLLFGFLGDRKQVNRLYLFCWSLIMTGTVLGLVPLFTTFLHNTLLAGLFGLLSASSEALTTVIIVDILGLDKLTDAYGIVMFLQGIANLLGPPLAGKFITFFLVFSSDIPTILAGSNVTCDTVVRTDGEDKFE